MEEKFVTLAVANKLKEKGFNEQCLAFFNANGKLVRYSDCDLDPHDIEKQVLTNERIKVPNTYAAPLWIDALIWYNGHPDHKLFMDGFFELDQYGKEQKMLLFLNNL